MKIGILQPGYLPWLGFFEQMARVDHFVYFDDVQYTRKDWRSRNRIKTAGGVTFLTVPIRKAPRDTPINRIEISYDQPWSASHLRAIELNYGKAPHFEPLYSQLAAVLQRRFDLLVDLDQALVEVCCALLGIRTPVSRSSELGIQTNDRNDRIVQVCQALGATALYDGASARDFIDVDLFQEHGVCVSFQDYEHPAYPQRWGPFVSHLSVIDLMMNAGPESLGILLNSPNSDRAEEVIAVSPKTTANRSNNICTLHAR